MVKIDVQECKIIKELIKNPRISDNQLSKNTGIPVMTVNRKRKRLEEEQIINYYVSVKKHQDGIGTFAARQLYIIKLKAGITRRKYIDSIEMDQKLKVFNSKFVSTTYLGEKDGHLALVIVLDAVNDHKLVDEFNGRIIEAINNKFGDDSVEEVTTTRLNDTIRMHHNYLPQMNMANGRMKEDWPEEYIFTGVKEKHLDLNKL